MAKSRLITFKAVEILGIRLFWLIQKTGNRRQVKNKRGLSSNTHALNSAASRANQQATKIYQAAWFFNNRHLVMQTTRKFRGY